MLLLFAAALWLAALLFVVKAPRLRDEARRSLLLDLAAAGALGLGTAGFFWRLLFTANVWMPAGGGDLAGFLYPTYQFAQEWLTRGVIPLWNPFIFGGTSFVGDIQSALFYPLNLITYFLSKPLAYRDLEYLSVLHFFIAGAGMYALLRFGPFTRAGDANRLPLRRAACLAGAVAFEFSDLFITHFGNLNLIASAAWLPLAILFFSRALERTGLRNAIAAGVFLALSFFAGHIQSFLFIALALALYALYFGVRRRDDARRSVTLLILTFAIAAGLSAVTLLPGLEMSRLSVRSAFTYEDAAQYSLPPAELVGLLVPGFFGRGPESAWGPWSRVEVGYLGVLPLLLAGLALVLRRNSKTVFFAFVALAGLLLALGGYAILHGWLFEFVPGFGQIRAPARIILLLDFGLAALAAFGFDAVISALNQAARKRFSVLVRRGAWLALVIMLTAGALALGILILGQGQDPALYDRIARAANALAFFILLLALSMGLLVARARAAIDPPVWSGLALALIFFDLFSLGAYVDVGTSDPTLAYQRYDIIDFLRANAGLARIDSRTDVESLWRPDTGLLYRLQDLNGENPLLLSDYDAYWQALAGRGTEGYAMLNVKYLLARRGTPVPDNFVQVLQGGGGITVYENQCDSPRAWLNYNSLVVTDWSLMFKLAQRDCSMHIPISQVPVTFLMGEGAKELRSGRAGLRPVEVTGYGPNQIEVNLRAEEEGYLVLSEVYAPGWRAWVDDREAPVVRANFLFRAVPVSPGDHRVRLVYDPLSFKLGAIVSGVTALAIVAGWLLSRRFNRRVPGATA